MKRVLILLIALGMVTFSIVPAMSEVGCEPICVDPCDPPVYEDEAEVITVCDNTLTKMLDEGELLGITSDGCYVIRYKGKVYICVPKKLKK